MATSFNGWGASWGASWGATPTSGTGEMFGLALFSVAASGTLTNGSQDVIAPWPSLPIPMRKIPRKPREEDEALLLTTIL